MIEDSDPCHHTALAWFTRQVTCSAYCLSHCCLVWTECGTLSLSIENLAHLMTPDLCVTMGIMVALITMDDFNAASC